MTQSQGKAGLQGPPKNHAAIYTEIKVLSLLFEELGKRSKELEVSMGSKNYNEWISLYREVNDTLLALEKAICKRRLLVANRNLRSIREAVFSLFERYDSLSRALLDVDQKLAPRSLPNGGTTAEVRTPPVDDIKKELEKARERIKRLLGTTGGEGQGV